MVQSPCTEPPNYETKTITAVIHEESKIVLGSGLSRGYAFARLTTPGRSEVDLMRLDVTRHFDDLGLVTLRVVGGGIELWSSPTKGDGNEIYIVNGEATLDLTAIPIGSSMTIWVESVDRSVSVRDIVLDAFHNGIKSDRVRATGVWAIAPHETAPGTWAGVRHDRSDVAWSDFPLGPSGQLPHLGLVDVAIWNNVQNAIAMQFIVGPEDIQYERDVVFDATRQIERQVAQQSTIGSWSQLSPHLWFPAHVETPNDDTANGDESGKVNSDRHFYSYDSPGTGSLATGGLKGWSYSANFREWLRVSFDRKRPGDPGIMGSRVSDVFEWHARHDLTDRNLDGLWERSTGDDPETSLNNVAPGHIVLGYDQP